MNIIILICNRVIKIFGHLCKFLGYFYHFFAPKSRFKIPNCSNPIIKTKRKSNIPRILWQTNYTNLVSLPVYLNYLFNRIMSPTYEYRFMGTLDRLNFIKENFSDEIVRNYSRLNIGASQADFWRLLVLNKIGGIYMDIDAHLVWPMERIIRPNFNELFFKSKKDHFTNNILASGTNNPNLEKAIRIVMENIQSGKDFETIYEITGPPVINEALEGKKVEFRYSRFSCAHGTFTNEYFQYIDKKEGKWTRAKKNELLKKL